MNQELAVELLTNAGMEVVLANNGQEALDVLANDPHFDGVLMDCQMPVMDGYTATRAIRKNPAFEKLPIIAMTANAMAGDKEKVLEAGMWDHIAKPLNVGLMFATLARWIHPEAKFDPSKIATKSVASGALQMGHIGLFGALSDVGVDTRFGLKTALNKEALYLRLLRKFRDGQSDFAGLFARARTDTDAQAAQRCAHTLRGTAATIGAKQVQEAADDLEQACKQGVPDAQIEDQLQKVLGALHPVLRALQALPDEEVSANAQPPLIQDTQQLSAVRARLIALLERGDSAAMDLCEQEDALLSAAFPARWKAIAGSVNRFDFEAALALVMESK